MLGGLSDGVGNAVADGFRASGCGAVPLLSNREWPGRLDLIVIPGPMQPLTSLIARFGRVQGLPPVAVWFTEQTPNPMWSPAFVARVADLRWGLDWCAGSRIAARVPLGSQLLAGLSGKAGRLRLLGELRFLLKSSRLSLLAVFTGSNARFLYKFGLSSVRVPMGYHPSFGRLLGKDRDIDVVFLGSTRDRRRRRLIRGLSGRMNELGIRFVIRDGSPEHGSAHGEERVNLLNSAKIMLSIMRQPWDDPVFRILLAAPNGAMVLSEQVCDAGPFKPGEHFAAARLDDLVEAIRYYLANDSARREIANTAYDFVTRHLTMEQMASGLLSEFEARRRTG